MSLGLLLQILVSFLILNQRLCVRVLRSSFFLQKLLKLLKSVLLEADLRFQVVIISLQLHYLLVQRDLFVFKARDFALQLTFVGLLVIRDALESHKFIVNLVSLRHNQILTFLCFLKLSCHVVDMTLQSQYFLHVVLFFLLMFCNLERRASDLFLSTLNLTE